ncbi:MAG TPA: cellulose synthase catalytic subunit [Solirubrobacteraceae bacterium]|nr:cellulose synthase catalytic subunit [Solirubrobacteraceae bacterium]
MHCPDDVLPLPPSDEQKFSYVKRHLWLLNFFAVSSFAAVAYSTIMFSELDDALWPFFALLGLAAAGFVLSLQADVFSRDFDTEEHRRRVATRSDGARRYPSVDVFLPICGEDRSVLLNTWRHVLALDYPSLTVYCLDDSGEETMRSVAEELGFRYLRRDNPGWFKKAGNLQFAYENSCGEFILILDADFAPRRDFLRETLPYFAAQSDLGIVQTPQFFATSRRQNWLERGAGAVQELFYRVVQVSRGHWDAAICVGTCAVYRRTALDSNGGTTLIEHSEDIHTGFDLRRRGWRLRYVPVNLAAGLCPDNLPAFFRQQYRWCLGSLSLCTARKFWSTKMPTRTRMCYLAGFAYYILTALAVITAPLIPLTLTLFFPGRIRLVNYLVLLPALLWLYVLLPLWHRSRFRWETLSVKVTYGWAHAFAIFDLLRRCPMAWTATGERAREHRLLWFRLLATVWGTGTGLLLVGACLWQVLRNGHSTLQFAPMVAFALLYLATNLRLIFAPAPSPPTAPPVSISINDEAKVSHETSRVLPRASHAPPVAVGLAVDGADRGL